MEKTKRENNDLNTDKKKEVDAETVVTDNVTVEEKCDNSNNSEATNDTKDSKDKTQKASKEIAELNDKYIRLYAEYENYRRRSEKEKGESYLAGNISAITAFLPLIDNLDTALSYEPENNGLKIICKQVKDTFEKLGVTEIESDGKPFDPEIHNAIMHEEDSSQGENIVAQTFRKGYKIGDKIIRHAMVKVVN